MIQQPVSLAAKERKLKRDLEDLGAVVVGYSGGADSTYLAAVAHEVLGVDALAATAVSPSLARHELKSATDVAQERGWNHVLIETNEVSREEYARNSPDRCYWCKTELFEVFDPIARRRGARVALGTNTNDLGDFRPGGRAAREAGALTPLVDAGLSKSEIRELSRGRGLPTADKPASACLASRFAYGVRVTVEGLRRIDEAEQFLRELGFGVFRVRDHGDLARIEVDVKDIERAAGHHGRIEAELRNLGWKYVTLDLTGFRSGSMNEVLGSPRIRNHS